jgi:hypothetical protein
MDEGFIFGSSVNLWEVDKNERVRISIATSLEKIFKYMTKFMINILIINYPKIIINELFRKIVIYDMM